ncbi:PhzF family phenazine biosynthesis protein [Brevibacterium sp. UCMA 11754]|uniref:PhzF family phenazine biosynthesis protein n=1 Tax=Brevibacterium sp. UCMA 11754 TaxID=2749198 RepID=UPI001F46C4F8|nr:PhzF family phenazine biosynthesis protein [Brevibacterium sp. UCMA 11754]MCF2573616.1 PhzF family phenazine biosynthesis protein [Brevibacterium sp. UCMA 11754]
MTTQIPFAFVDVFAREPLSGNPLALIPEADGLEVAQMRAIAREFNQSETTFLVSPTMPTAQWQLRSFTPDGTEVLGAGHNAMGAWIWLAITGCLPVGTKDFTQQIGDELLPVHVSRDDGGRYTVTMVQPPPEFGKVVPDRRALARSLGLEEVDLDSDRPAQVVSTGAGHLLVPVRNRRIVDRVVPDSALLLAELRNAGGEGCYVYSRDPIDADGGSVAYARFFNPTVGIAEDPATGTAAGPLVAALVRAGEIDQDVEATVEQGDRLGRPSRLRVTVTGPQVSLSGSGLFVADGVLHL